jgi:hypothetical protein
MPDEKVQYSCPATFAMDLLQGKWMREHQPAFRRIQRPLRRGANPRWRAWQQAPIQGCPRHTEGAAGSRFPDAVTQLQGSACEFPSSIWTLGIGLPNSAATLFEPR